MDLIRDLLRRTSSGLVLSIVCIGGLGLVTACSSTRAEPTGNVVLNEISYHPESDGGGEFLELYNTNGPPVDLSGWCFVRGVRGCFADGTVIDTDGYVVAAEDPKAFASAFGLQPTLVYEGRLSNGGETVELVDSTGRKVFSCSYDDTYPWPVATDGHGPSLERVTTGLDCSDPRAWTASVDPTMSTPMAPNSVENPDYASVRSVAVSPLVDSDRSVSVRANARNAETAWVEYRVGHDEVERVDLRVESTSDGDATTDGTWTGTIPVGAESGLLRYRVVVESADAHRSSEPSAHDTVEFRAVMLEHPDTPDLPVVTVHLSDHDSEKMDEDPSAKVRVPAVIAVGDDVFDNATISYKGSSTLGHPKKQFEVRLPDGYEVTPSSFGHPVSGFDLQTEASGYTQVAERPAWSTLGSLGVPVLHSEFVRLHKDDGTGTARFVGTYLLREEYDRGWQRAHGHDDGDVFKHGRPRSPDVDGSDDDPNDADAFLDGIAPLEGDDLERYLIEHLDVPAYINFIAAAHVIGYGYHDWDWSFNVNEFHDVRRDRWTYLPLDLDTAYDWQSWPPLPTGELFDTTIDPAPPAVVDVDDDGSHLLERKVFSIERFREMYFARVVTIDDVLRNGTTPEEFYRRDHDAGLQSFVEDFELWYDEMIGYFTSQTDVYGEDGELFEFSTAQAKTVAGMREPASALRLFDDAQRRRLRAFDSFYSDGLLKRSDPEGAMIEISVVWGAVDEDGRVAVVRLRNPGTEPVDVSGWRLTNIGTELPPGSVLGAGRCASVVSDDSAKARPRVPSTGVVFTETKRPLDPGGGSIELRRSDATPAGWVNYVPAPKEPTSLPADPKPLDTELC